MSAVNHSCVIADMLDTVGLSATWVTRLGFVNLRFFPWDCDVLWELNPRSWWSLRAFHRLTAAQLRLCRHGDWSLYKTSFKRKWVLTFYWRFSAWAELWGWWRCLPSGRQGNMQTEKTPENQLKLLSSKNSTFCFQISRHVALCRSSGSWKNWWTLRK